MANTTFSGPVRSESTLKTVLKSSTGVVAEVTTLGDGPVSLSAETLHLQMQRIVVVFFLFQMGAKITLTRCLPRLPVQYSALFMQVVPPMPQTQLF